MRTVNVQMKVPEGIVPYLDDTERHALKVDDLDYSEYPNQIPILPEGSYHGYDITFFYRNLEENVNTRVKAWLAAH